jgi:hypothetical protein
LPAQRNYLPDQGIGLRGIELTPADPADLTVFVERAEPSIRPSHKIKRVFKYSCTFTLMHLHGEIGMVPPVEYEQPHYG